jgi:hypothetical protein
MLKKIMKAALAASLVFGFSAGVHAEDFFKMYGSARMALEQTTVTPDVGDADTDLSLAQQGNSRFGASAQKGMVSGGFEYGTSANLRLLYASVPMGGGSLLLGQHYVPVNIFVSNQVAGGDAGMLNYGGLYGGRRAMIKYATGGLNVAFVQPTAASLSGVTASDTDVSMPKIEASYAMKFGNINVKAVFGTQSSSITRAATAATAASTTYSIDTGAIVGTAVAATAAAAEKTFTVSSQALGLQAGINLGAAAVKFSYMMATNGGNYGLWMNGGSNVAELQTDSVVDAKSSGMLLVGSFKVSDTMGLEGGYGSLTSTAGTTGAKDDGSSVMYVQLAINMGNGMTITPNYNMWDNMKNGADVKEGTVGSIGAKFQANF